MRLAPTEHAHAQQTQLFRNLLKQRRDALGWTQKRLGDEIGVTQSTISDYENGTVPIPNERIRALADALGIDLLEALQLLGDTAQSFTQDYGSAKKLATILAAGNFVPLLDPPGETVIVSFLAAVEAYRAGRLSQFRRQWPDTVRECERALQHLDQATAQLRAYILDVKGNAEAHSEMTFDAERTYATISHLAVTVDDRYLRGQMYTHQAELWRQRGNWREALEEFRKALAEFRAADQYAVARQARVRRKMALVYLAQGRWRDAERELVSSRDVFEVEQSNYELAKVDMAEGWLRLYQGRLDDAIQVRRRACERAHAHRVLGQNVDHYLLYQAHYYLALALRERGAPEDMREAQENLRQARAHADQLPQIRAQSAVRFGQAQLMLDECLSSPTPGAHWEATDQLLEQIEFSRSDWLETGYIYMLRGLLKFEWHSRFRRTDHDLHLAARAMLERAQLVFAQLENGVYLAETYFHLARCDLHQGDTTSAAKHIQAGLSAVEDSYGPLPSRVKALLTALQAEMALHHPLVEATTRDPLKQRLAQAGKLYGQALVVAHHFNRSTLVAVQRFIHTGYTLLDGFGRVTESRPQLRVLIVEEVSGWLDACVAKEITQGI
jgi:transcriptional regulator with XRE-family HTH domain